MRELLRIITATVLVVGLTHPLVAESRSAAAQHFQRAQTLLEDLRAVPRPELGRRQYDLVIKAFESVHRTSPSSGYCDDALLAVAQLYAEKHDRFGDERYRTEAVNKYQFLIREYPHSSLLQQARAEMAKLEKGGNLTLSQVKNPTPVDDEPAPKQAAPAPKPAPAQQPRRSEPAPQAEPQVTLTSTTTPSAPLRENRVGKTPARIGTGTVAIKDLRYWSTPEYTRIAIELDDYAPFKFEFLSRPRRMYFDLLTSELQGELMRGGSFEVGGPAVERLRIAMNRSNKARLVMDLNDEVFYDVAWLTNPPRLMIELQPKTPQRQTLARNEEPAPAVERAPEPEPEAEPEEVETAAVEPEPEPSPAPLPVAGRVAEKPATFAEAFRALASGGVVRRAAPAPAPEKYTPKRRASTAPRPRSIVADDAAPAITEISKTSGADPPVMLAKLEPPPSPVEEELAPQTVPLNLAPPKPADEPSKGSQSLIRALGLKVGKVVIDAGHGGHDTGSIGPSGLLEKDVVLDVSQRLAKLIRTRLGSEVLLTREDDKFLDLSVRNAVANKAGADLFISVHANSFTNRTVRGVETYYLNFTTDPWALKVASRENAASSKTVHELQDLLSKIALKEKIDESREFAERMQSVLYGGLSTTTNGLRDRGVRQAPLMVLIGAKMPAILAEIGFLSNPTDEKLLKSSKYRQQVAEYLYEGIESYVGSLSSHQLTMTEQERASASLD